ncbi:MAG: hypothetical protein PUE01_01205 [Clostridiaceae bacterium]|nr:hypothetical protein [Clostridiaceae bacterium]
MKFKKVNLSSSNTLFSIGMVLALISCILNMFSFIEAATISLPFRLIIFIIGAGLMFFASYKKDKVNAEKRK